MEKEQTTPPTVRFERHAMWKVTLPDETTVKLIGELELFDGCLQISFVDFDYKLERLLIFASGVWKFVEFVKWVNCRLEKYNESTVAGVSPTD
jgi:hypothetical protein